MAMPKNKSNIGKNQNSIKTRFKKGHKLWDHPNVKLHQFSKGKSPWNKGKFGARGEFNPTWLGGRKSWITNFVKTRDNYTCQICGLYDKEIIEADHIKPKSEFPELEFDADNIISICPNCHRRRTNRYLKERAERKRNEKL